MTSLDPKIIRKLLYIKNQLAGVTEEKVQQEINPRGERGKLNASKGMSLHNKARLKQYEDSAESIRRSLRKMEYKPGGIKRNNTPSSITINKLYAELNSIEKAIQRIIEGDFQLEDRSSTGLPVIHNPGKVTSTESDDHKEHQIAKAKEQFAKGIKYYPKHMRTFESKRKEK